MQMPIRARRACNPLLRIDVPIRQVYALPEKLLVRSMNVRVSRLVVLSEIDQRHHRIIHHPL
jgi:hypothetical protein